MVHFLTNVFLAVLGTIPIVDSFLFGGGGGCGCGSPPPPSCPPPAPPQPCARGVKNLERAPIFGVDREVRFAPRMTPPPSPMPRVMTVPDELDLRAAAFGVPFFVPQQQQKYSVFDVLHNLGDDEINQKQHHDQSSATIDSNYVLPSEDDYDLTLKNDLGGLVRSKEIRRSPTEPIVRVHRDEKNLSTSTISSEIVKVDVEQVKDINKCNSSILRKLMLENMNDSSADSKKNVNLAAEAKFGGNVDVICSRGHFSYIFTSNLFCEATKGLTTCIAFRQTEKVNRT